jgi:hypothetical protein
MQQQLQVLIILETLEEPRHRTLVVVVVVPGRQEVAVLEVPEEVIGE